MKAFPLCLAMGLVLQAHGAQAQQVSEEDELTLVYGDKNNVSIATGSTQSLRRAPAVASVVTAQDIAAMGATDLDQVMETIAGIHVKYVICQKTCSSCRQGLVLRLLRFVAGHQGNIMLTHLPSILC